MRRDSSQSRLASLEANADSMETDCYISAPSVISNMSPPCVYSHHLPKQTCPDVACYTMHQSPMSMCSGLPHIPPVMVADHTDELSTELSTVSDLSYRPFYSDSNTIQSLTPGRTLQQPEWLTYDANPYQSSLQSYVFPQQAPVTDKTLPPVDSGFDFLNRLTHYTPEQTSAGAGMPTASMYTPFPNVEHALTCNIRSTVEHQPVTAQAVLSSSSCNSQDPILSLIRAIEMAKHTDQASSDGTFHETCQIMGSSDIPRDMSMEMPPPGFDLDNNTPGMVAGADRLSSFYPHSVYPQVHMMDNADTLINYNHENTDSMVDYQQEQQQIQPDDELEQRHIRLEKEIVDLTESVDMSEDSNHSQPSHSFLQNYPVIPPTSYGIDAFQRYPKRHCGASAAAMVSVSDDSTQSPSNNSTSSKVIYTQDVGCSAPFLSNNDDDDCNEVDIVQQDEISFSDIIFGDKIGEGAFGEVYKGLLWGQEVALKRILAKIVQPKHLLAFKKEVKIMRQLRHPNIVAFMGVCWSPSVCIVTEYLSNGSLEDLLRSKRLSFKRSLRYATDIGRGLNWMHNKKIIHRDLKPSNLLVDKNGNVKIADFGLAHMKRRKPIDSGTYGVCGTPVYMAPEVINNAPYATQADVFSFGILLCEMLTGEYPYDRISASTQTFEQAIVSGLRPPIPSNCPALMRSLVESCWQQDPSLRPSMEQVMNTLGEIERMMFAPDLACDDTADLEDLPDEVLKLIQQEKTRVALLESAIQAEREHLRLATERIMEAEATLKYERTARVAVDKKLNTLESKSKKTTNERDRIKVKLLKKEAELRQHKEEIQKMKKEQRDKIKQDIAASFTLKKRDLKRNTRKVKEVTPKESLYVEEEKSTIPYNIRRNNSSSKSTRKAKKKEKDPRKQAKGKRRYFDDSNYEF